MAITNLTHQRAHYYVSLNWPIVPVHNLTQAGTCSCSKGANCSTPGKHPVGKDWQYHALTTPEQVDAYFHQRPDANVGLLLGHGVIDIEFDNDAGEALANELGLNEIATPTYRSARSVHRLFKPPINFTSTVSKIKDVLEVRLGTERAAQSVLPPSRHESGITYEWCDGLDPSVPLAEFPESVLKLLSGMDWDETERETDAFQVFVGERDLDLEVDGGVGKGRVHEMRTSLIGSFIKQNWPMEDESKQQCKALARAWNQRCRTTYGADADDTKVDKEVEDFCENHQAQIEASPTIKSTKAATQSFTDYREFQPFPLHALPPEIGHLVSTASAAVDCDPTFILMPLLATVASLIGNTRRLHAKQKWLVPPVLWTGIVGDSGTRKSPGYRFVTEPLDELEDELAARYDVELQQHSTEQMKYEQSLRSWKAKNDPNLIPPTKPQDPQLQELKGEDVTIEALFEMLHRNPNGLLVGTDELAGWFDRMDRYSAGGERSMWLSFFNAGRAKKNRNTGDKRVLRIRQAAVSITGGIQEEVLRKRFTGEALSSGLASRFLLTNPPDTIHQWTDDDIDTSTIEGYYQLIRRLRLLTEQQPMRLVMSPEAKSLYVDFYNSHNVQKIDTVGATKAAWNKLEELPLRLALIFQTIVDPTSTSVVLPVMTWAVQATGWFRDETERIYDMLTAPDEEFEHIQLRQWMVSKGGATVREIQRKFRKYRKLDISKVEKILRLFCDIKVDGKRRVFVPKERGW